MWLDVYEQFSELTESEKIALFNVTKQDFFPEDPEKGYKTAENHS